MLVAPLERSFVCLKCWKCIQVNLYVRWQYWYQTKRPSLTGVQAENRKNFQPLFVPISESVSSFVVLFTLRLWIVIFASPKRIPLCHRRVFNKKKPAPLAVLSFERVEVRPPTSLHERQAHVLVKVPVAARTRNVRRWTNEWMNECDVYFRQLRP